MGTGFAKYLLRALVMLSVAYICIPGTGSDRSMGLLQMDSRHASQSFIAICFAP
jgi:hypothetical protein